MAKRKSAAVAGDDRPVMASVPDGLAHPALYDWRVCKECLRECHPKRWPMCARCASRKGILMAKIEAA